MAVISFNVDEQVGLVSIPRNWLVDEKGARRLEQVGLLESADWVRKLVEAIEKVN